MAEPPSRIVVPNLYGREPRALTLYLIAVGLLLRQRRFEEIVVLCRGTRRHARRASQLAGTLDTFSFEIRALVELGRYDAAWRQLRRWEREADQVTTTSPPGEPGRRPYVLYFRYQLLWLAGRPEAARRVAEPVLHDALAAGRPSFVLLFSVYKPIRRPRLLEHVTLRHIYAALGRGLGEWDDWEPFVRGFHPRLFDLTGVPRESLLRDPRRIAGFYRWIETERARRCISGVSEGEADLVDPASRVAARQRGIVRDMRRHREGMAVTSSETDRKLAEWFPFLGACLGAAR